MVAMLSSILKYKKYGEMAEKHHISAVEYSKFYREVKLELVLDTAERSHAIEYSKTIKNNYDKLLSNSPEIPGHISKHLEKIKESPCSKSFIYTNASIPFCL
jgi:hypothetical protein